MMKKSFVFIAFLAMVFVSGCTVSDKPPESEALIPAISDTSAAEATSAGDSTAEVTESTAETAVTTAGQGTADNTTAPSVQATMPPNVAPAVPTTVAPTAPAAATAASPAVGMSAESAKVVELCNVEREKAGLAPVRSDNAQLQQAADLRAAELHVSFSHTRPDGSSCFTVMKEFGVSYSVVGENVALGQKTPEQVVNAWMNSQGHRDNIMNASFTTIAVGYNSGAWAQLFIG